MKLKTLLNKVPLKVYKGSKDVEITGLCSHSKLVAPGNLFIAKKGLKDDGLKYIDEAVASGAVAVLSDMGNPFLKKVVQLVHEDVSSVEPSLASHFYNHPSKELFTVGITGTNGKTTTSYILKYLLDQLSQPAGLIGTIEYILGGHSLPSERTTPEVITNHRLLHEMIKLGCVSAIMEVTSHGLVQKRVGGIDFDVAVFTNLTQDHLDYHKTLEEYAKAKSLLFSQLSKDKFAVINHESPWSKIMVKDCLAQIFTYGFTSDAQLYAHHLKLSPKKTEFQVTYLGETVDFSWSLIGKHNVLNALAAIAVLITRGVGLKVLSEKLSSFKGIPGRLERVKDRNIFVDYAHTPDALENVLSCLLELKKKRIITVFGCGGDRDRGKRPLMAAAAEKYSDVTIVTSDNPRSEDPSEICHQIVQGFTKNDYIVELERKLAIRKAIEIAEKEDLILIAGKGHETYQIFSHQTIPFDDKKIAAEWIELLGKSQR